MNKVVAVGAVEVMNAGSVPPFVLVVVDDDIFVADIANERTGDRRRVDPTGPRFHLKAATIVLKKDGEEAVVGVLADAPKRCRVLRERGVVEDAKRISGSRV